MQKILLILGVIMGCANVVEEAEIGQCLQHKFENGMFKVKKKSEDQLVLEELSAIGPGPIKVVNRFYGGWIVVACPQEKAQEKEN